MKYFFKIRVLFLFALLLLIGTIGALSQDNTMHQFVQIQLQPVSGTSYYEIQWLRQKNTNPSSIIQTQKVYRTNFQRKAPLHYRFFRVRSFSRQGISGPWSNIHALPKQDISTKPSQTVASGFKTIKSANGTDKKYFVGSSLPIQKLSGKNADGFSVNNSAVKPMQPNLAIQSDGQYNISIVSNKNNKDKKNKTIREWNFHVDRTPPKTKIFIYPLFYNDADGIWIGPKSKIILRGTDTNSGLKNIFYRISDDGPFLTYQKEISLGDFNLPQTKFSSQKDQKALYIQYYAIDRLDNKEKTNRIRIYLDQTPPKLSLLSSHTKKLIDDKKGHSIMIGIQDQSQPVTIDVYLNTKLIKTVTATRQVSIQLPDMLTGEHTLRLKAKDLLQNSTIWEQKINLP